MSVSESAGGGRILGVRLSGLGDVVHALCALSRLRRERPDAHLAWAVEDRFASLLRGHPQIDELIVLPRGRWAAALRSPVRWFRLGAELRGFAGQLRRRALAVTIDFQSSLKSAWLVAASGARMRVGFAPPVSRELSHLVQTHAVRIPGAGIHRIERDLALLGPLGISTAYADPVVPIDGAGAEALEAALAGLRGGGPLVAIHPGTSQFAAFKRWAPERHARVADGLVRERSADVVVTYGPEDRYLAERVVGCMGERGSLAPRTEDLRQLARLLSGADLFIGSDTGPMHVASALGVPVVALFGPKDPEQTGPYCSRSLVVTGEADCRPCERRRCSHVRCMTSITADEVLAAGLEVLDGGGSCRAPRGEAAPSRAGSHPPSSAAGGQT
ncbi:MAG: glycosyltransferase family 9 protein [Planctomycetota bacterium]|jgi:lipopolysaccharide heptosyltransferase I